MAVGDQDHGRVAMPVTATLAGTVHQPLDLALGEIAALDCQVYDAWCAFLGCRFHAGKPCLRVSYCICYTLFLHSRKGAHRDRNPGWRRRSGRAAWWRGPRANLIFVLPTNVYVGPRVGGLFGFKFSSRPHPRKFGLKRFLAVRRSWRGNGVACFCATSLEEIIG